ncbi:27075_t:CDS:2 [Gigaspora margarita]|uniref:27075_t:CDS:1 n=1 Tax=Gigaspora margarita TaxID=4874 RepID=A0ABN7VK85_GIGMA|nr:27075_t:CDS:2 [Gigaspora margarita]
MPELYCIWCTEYNRYSTSIFVVDTKKFKKDYLDKHIEIKEHQKAVEKFTQCQQSDQLDLMSSFTVQAGVNKLDIIAKMRCVYLCAKRHLAVEAFPDLIELTNLQVQNQIELVYDKPPITIAPPIFAGAEFLHALAVVIEEDILAESNTITHDKTCAIVRKHIVKNIPVLWYLGLIELDETNAEAIKLMHFGSDEINPFMTNHCIAHRLNLVGKDSAEEVSYFKYNEDPQLSILCVVNALYDEALNDSCVKTRQQAKALYDDIDSEFILATTYLADLLSIIKYIYDTIEYDELHSIFKKFALLFIKNLCRRFSDVGIYNAMRIFDFSQIPTSPREMVTFRENKIQLLDNFYGKFKQYNDTHFPAKVNRIELLKEWYEAKLVLKNYKELGFIEE